MIRNKMKLHTIPAIQYEHEGTARIDTRIHETDGNRSGATKNAIKTPTTFLSR
jgi:hypothetical protein